MSLQDVILLAASKNGLVIDIGPFNVRLRSSEKDFVRDFCWLYQDFKILSNDSFADFNIAIDRVKTIRKWIAPQVVFSIDTHIPFEPFPLSHALPLFEWGLNWCIARRGHNLLILHAGVLEKHGRALILPAFPGSGKSTLTAALAESGWRLLSDEFGLVRSDGCMVPIPRSVALKNASINIIKEFSLAADISEPYPKTRKGTVAYLKPKIQSVEMMKICVEPSLLIFPQYRAGSEVVCHELKKPYSFMKTATNAFNYEVMGKAGFQLIRQIVNRCNCYNLTYSNLNDAISTLDDLISDRHAQK